MKVILKKNYTCENCVKLKERQREMNFGRWNYICKKYNIGRNIDSDSCDNYE